MEKSSAFDYDDVYDGRLLAGERAPWDIGTPQPVFVRLLDTGKIRGHVLDAGCGTGEHALAVAARGYRVTGLDSAVNAVRMATDKARSRHLDVDFQVADCTVLEDFEDVFDTVLDCGLFHSLDPDGRRAYAAALHRASRAGAGVHVLSFSADGKRHVSAGLAGVTLPPYVARQFPCVDPGQLREAFSAGWVASAIDESSYSVRFPGTAQTIPIPALLATFERS